MVFLYAFVCRCTLLHVINRPQVHDYVGELEHAFKRLADLWVRFLNTEKHADIAASVAGHSPRRAAERAGKERRTAGLDGGRSATTVEWMHAHGSDELVSMLREHESGSQPPPPPPSLPLLLLRCTCIRCGRQ